MKILRLAIILFCSFEYLVISRSNEPSSAKFALKVLKSANSALSELQTPNAVLSFLQQKDQFSQWENYSCKFNWHMQKSQAQMERLTEEKDECPLVDDLQILKLPPKKRKEAKKLVSKYLA